MQLPIPHNLKKKWSKSLHWFTKYGQILSRLCPVFYFDFDFDTFEIEAKSKMFILSYGNKVFGVDFDTFEK